MTSVDDNAARLAVIRDLDEQGIVSVCTRCTEKVFVVQGSDALEVFDRQGTPHRLAGHCAGGAYWTFYGPYGGYSGAELLEEARREGMLEGGCEHD